jgi:serine/threonine protein phosphatase PrpC
LHEDTLVEEDIHPTYVSAGITDAGRLRSSNQDAFVVRDEAGLWAVADGMGGYRDGDVASRMVCDALSAAELAASADESKATICGRISEVNQRLYGAATREINPVISGSTVVAFLVRRTSCVVLWAGDSRVYRLRHRHLTQLTTDHTWAAELNLPGGEDADHAITRAVGGEETLQLAERRDRVRLGDRYLLCSDGLTRELSDEQIASLMAEGDVQQCARALIDAVLQTAARDNVTVVIVEAQ